MKKDTSMKVIVHYPKTKEGQKELANRVADIHANYIINTIDHLECPTQQKINLLKEVIDIIKERSPL